MLRRIRKPKQPQTEQQEILVNVDVHILMLVLTILMIANSVLLVIDLLPEQHEVVRFFQVALSVILLTDFFLRLLHYRHGRRHYLSRMLGWMVFLGSLPFPFFGVFRLIQLVVVTRRLKTDDYREIAGNMIERRGRTAITSVTALALIVMELGSIIIIGVESRAEAPLIVTGGDALWYTLVTIATVGYGDKYPVTMEGRLVGSVIIIMGVIVFTTLTSFMAQWFLTSRGPAAHVVVVPPKNEPGVNDPATEVRDLLERLQRDGRDHNETLTLVVKLLEREQE